MREVDEEEVSREEEEVVHRESKTKIEKEIEIMSVLVGTKESKGLEEDRFTKNAEVVVVDSKTKVITIKKMAKCNKSTDQKMTSKRRQKNLMMLCPTEMSRHKITMAKNKSNTT